MRAAERLSELGPLVVGSIKQVLCPLADIECGELVGGVVVLWLKRDCCDVRRVDVAYAQVNLNTPEAGGDEDIPAQVQRIDTISIAQPSWQQRLIIDGHGILPEGLQAIREMLTEILPLRPESSIHLGEGLRQQYSLIVPFAAFSSRLPGSLPAVAIGDQQIRLFDFVVDASVADIVRFLHLQVPNGVRLRGPVTRQAAQVLAGYRPDPRALRRSAAGAYLSHCIREATGTAWASSHIFELIDDLSRMRHEQVAVAGNIAFAAPDVAREACTVRLHSDVLRWVSDASRHGQPIVSELRIVRKLLHGTSPKWLLVISDGVPVGWAPRDALASSPEAVRIAFKRPGKWLGQYQDSDLLAVIDGQVQRAADVSPRLLVESALQRLRHLGLTWDEAYIVATAGRVADADHGGLLVFMEDAEEFVRSHEHSCIPVEPVRIEPEAVATAAMMDGAMIFDLIGTCYAIAAILDGESCGAERIDRGARYNAALRFCAGRDVALCIVTSDDGIINVIPSRAARHHD